MYKIHQTEYTMHSPFHKGDSYHAKLVKSAKNLF